MSPRDTEDYRIEHDTMGEVRVPINALYRAQTQRAVENFPISGRGLEPAHIIALAQIKRAAALINKELGILEGPVADAIVAAADEIISGSHLEHFPVDTYQTGSGTSSNMNANEVITNRALEILGKGKGERNFIHPNDHVNNCQSSNDVFPSAIHISAYQAIKERLIPGLKELHSTFEAKSREFASIIKSGRTHLQDATPITLGQEFGGYASQLKHGIERVEHAAKRLLKLALGGTAVGTGLNTHPEFAAKAIANIATLTGSPFVEADNHFEAQAKMPLLR